MSNPFDLELLKDLCTEQLQHNLRRKGFSEIAIQALAPDKERSEIETALLMADIEFKRWKLIGDCLTEINQSFLLYGNVSPEDMMRVIDVHGRKLFKEYWAENKK